MSISTTNAIPSYIATATVPALTTIFTPPASCLNRFVLNAGTNDVAYSTYSRDGYQPPVDPLYYSCLPSRLRGPHYSPGICTDGQTIAGMTKFEDDSRTMWQAQCCKTGMTISVQTIQSSPVPMCVSAIATPLPVHALLTTVYTNGVTSSMYDYIANDQSTKSNMTTLTRGTAVADPLYVAWEAKDLSLFPVAYATSLAQKIGVSFTPTATPSGTAGSGPNETGGNTSTGGDDTSGLSTGAKIGIGVGAGGGALVLGLLGAFFLLRRRKQNRQVSGKGEYSPPVGSGYADDVVTHHELAQPDEPTGKVKYGHAYGAGGENGGMVMNELDSRPVGPQSMPPVELPGSESYGHVRKYARS